MNTIGIDLSVTTRIDDCATGVVTATIIAGFFDCAFVSSCGISVRSKLMCWSSNAMSLPSTKPWRTTSALNPFTAARSAGCSPKLAIAISLGCCAAALSEAARAIRTNAVRSSMAGLQSAKGEMVAVCRKKLGQCGRGESRMSETRMVEFDALPRKVRERFIAITIGTGGPQPFLAERTSTGSKIFGLSFLAVVVIVLIGVMLAVGAGSLYSSQSIHGPLQVMIGYTVFLFALVLVVLVIVQRKRFGSLFPFQPGRYLFATDFVDARSGTLRIAPTRLLGDFKGTHMHTNSSYTHTLLTF